MQACMLHPCVGGPRCLPSARLCARALMPPVAPSPHKDACAQGKHSSAESRPMNTSSRDSMLAEMGSEDVLTCVKVFEEDAYALQHPPARPASPALVYVEDNARGETAHKRAKSTSTLLLQSRPLLPRQDHSERSPVRAAAVTSQGSDSAERGRRSTPSKTRHALIVRPSTSASPARPMRQPGSASPVPQAGHSGHELHVLSNAVVTLQQHDPKDGKPLVPSSKQDTGQALDDLFNGFEDGALSMFASVLDLTLSGVSPKVPGRSRTSRSRCPCSMPFWSSFLGFVLPESNGRPGTHACTEKARVCAIALRTII